MYSAIFLVSSLLHVHAKTPSQFIISSVPNNFPEH